MERKMGQSRVRASSKASSPHGCQSTGLCACWRRYGLFSCARRLTNSDTAHLESIRRHLDVVEALVGEEGTPRIHDIHFNLVLALSLIHISEPTRLLSIS